MRTLEGDDMTVEYASQAVGSALRIAPRFVATATSAEVGVQTSLEAHYVAREGRYVVKAVTNRAANPDVEINHSTVARIKMQALVQEAAPRCIFLTLGDESDPLAEWLSVHELTTAEGRILPPTIAEAVVRRGSSEARMDAVEVLYGSAALASIPPAQLLQRELGIPHRTASAWIIDARKAGRLEGMNYHAGRPAHAL